MFIFDKNHKKMWYYTIVCCFFEFWMFSLKGKYWPSKVKHWNTNLTAVMTLYFHHIKVISRYGQGQYPILTSRSQGQSQDHKGHFCISTDFMHFAELVPQFWQENEIHRNVFRTIHRDHMQRNFDWPSKVEHRKPHLTALMTPISIILRS